MFHAIILAGGRGTRLIGAPMPKQFIEIAGRTLLERTVAPFLSHTAIASVTIVVPEEFIDFVKTLFSGPVTKQVRVIKGGASRQSSSYAALSFLKDKLTPDDFVLIHDGGRVLVDYDIISRAIEASLFSRAATAALPAEDTLMQVNGALVSGALERAKTIIVQTPQTFRYETILSAHERALKRGEADGASDDVSLLDHDVVTTHFLGSKRNFKVTTAADLELLKALIAWDYHE